MKKIFISFLLILTAISVNAQEDKTDLLRELENDQTVNPITQQESDPAVNQDIILIATLKSATRLFGAKNDLTTVIMVLPSGSEMEILDSDSTYLHIYFEDYEGYIYKDRAVISEVSLPVATAVEAVEEEPVITKAEPIQQVQPVQEPKVSRFSYLENKYGSNMAAKLMAGKIWKGMSAEMIIDSWGNPKKINRVISGNVIKEEWIFRNTWLYLENDILADWGSIGN